MKQFEIIISPTAQSDLQECVCFVLKVSQKAARELTDCIYASIESLSQFPERYPAFIMYGISMDLRKLIVNKRYIVLYQILDNKVIVHRILDGRRNFDGLL